MWSGRGCPWLNRKMGDIASPQKAYLTRECYDYKDKDIDLFINFSLIRHDYPNTIYCSPAHLCYYGKTWMV